VVALAGLLRAYRPVDLPLIVLAGLAEHGQQHNPPIRSTPVGEAGRNIAEPDPQFPDRPVQVVRPRAAKFGALLGKQAADLIDTLIVAVAEAVQLVADLRLELEPVESACLPYHGK
jgi:hypothetical protein